MSGTPRKVTLDGISYNWAADADITEEVDQEVEGIPTSGQTMFKTTKKIANVGGEIILEDGDFETLKSTAKKLVNYPMSYENSDGGIYRATGRVNIESRTTSENRVPITMIPEDGWVPFL